jgi:hypothetical protein
MVTAVFTLAKGTIAAKSRCHMAPGVSSQSQMLHNLRKAGHGWKKGSTMAWIFLLVYLASVLVACKANPAPLPTPSQDQIPLEQQAVYAAVLKKLYSASSYVIMDTTATSLAGVGDTSSTLALMVKNMPALDPVTVESFSTRNDNAYPLRPDMNLGSSYTLLSQAARTKIFAPNQDGWLVFYENYPAAPGITSLSQVGFNTALDQALVYVGTMSHWLAGAGYYFLLKKGNGVWIVEQQVLTWIS